MCRWQASKQTSKLISIKKIDAKCYFHFLFVVLQKYWKLLTTTTATTTTTTSERFVTLILERNCCYCLIVLFEKEQQTMSKISCERK